MKRFGFSWIAVAVLVCVLLVMGCAGWASSSRVNYSQVAAKTATGVAQDITAPYLTTGCALRITLLDAILNGGYYIRAMGGTGTTQYFALKEAGQLELGGPVFQTLVNAAGASANPWDFTGTLGIMDGSDDFTLFDVNITNADHTGSNTVQVMDVASITGDAHATETAYKIGTGWDYGVDSGSPVRGSTLETAGTLAAAGQVTLSRTAKTVPIIGATLTASTDGQNSTWTAAQLLGGFCVHDGSVGNGTATTCTGALLTAAVTGCATGDSFTCVMHAKDQQATVTAGDADITIVGTAAIPAGKCATLHFIKTATGASTWSCYVVVSA